MSQEIKLDEDTKAKIRVHLEQFEQTESTCIDKLCVALEKLGVLGENVELKRFHNILEETHTKKHTMLSQFTELKEVIDLDMEAIIEVDEELGQTIFKTQEVAVGDSNE